MPTLLLLDAEGKELDRQEGYPGLEKTLAWLREAPLKGLTLEALLVQARREPRSAHLQLAAARRLMLHGRVAEARPFFRRAEVGDAATAAAAVWERARAEERASIEAARLRAAAAVARRDPASPAAAQALRVLAVASRPPVPLVARIVEARLLAAADDPRMLIELAYLALRAGALDAAGKVAAAMEDRLEAGDNVELVRAAAEVANARGERERAVSLGRRAADAGPSFVRREMLGHVERFEKRPGAPAPELARLDEGWAIGADPVPYGRYTSGGSRALTRMFREAPERCAPVSEGMMRLSATAVVGRTPQEVRVFSDRGPVPTALADCLAKLIAEGEPTPGELLNFGLSLETREQRAAFDKLAQEAQARCGTQAGDPARPVTFEGFLSVEGPAKVVVALAGGPKALEACLESFFAQARLPAGSTRPVRFTFNRKPAARGEAAPR